MVLGFAIPFMALLDCSVICVHIWNWKRISNETKFPDAQMPNSGSGRYLSWCTVVVIETRVLKLQ